MPETTDPLAGLGAKDIPTRAASARDLAVAGGADVIDRLLTVAVRDTSPGVRLAAAGAAADILSRHRLPPVFPSIPAEDRARWLAAVAAVDPGLNTGLFAVCGTLGTPEAFARVLAGLRDPRQDVRAGACVGLWRAVVSSVVNGDAEMEARVVATLTDLRIRIESRVEIARICVDAGYGSSALAGTRTLPDQTTRRTREAAEELVGRMEAPPNLAGLWIDRGVDVGAVGGKARAASACIMLSRTDAIFIAENGQVARCAPEGPLRMLRAKAADKEALGPVLQIGLRSFWLAEAEDLCHAADRLIAAGRFDLLADCDDLIGVSSAGLRVRGAAFLAQGRLDEAVLALEASVAGKKVPTDASWFLADALHRLDRGGEAVPHLEHYLAKAPKRAPYLVEAKKRLAQLGG